MECTQSSSDALHFLFSIDFVQINISNLLPRARKDMCSTLDSEFDFDTVKI